jgi:hypothetical protein
MDTSLFTNILQGIHDYDIASMNIVTLVQVITWFIASVISFYFSIGNARVWTSISTGFFLIFLSQAFELNPLTFYAKMGPIHNMVGAISIILIAHGFLEYYIFSRTLEITGSKRVVYLSTLAMLALAIIFIVVNPTPSSNSVRNLKIIENTIWVILSVFILDLVRKIYEVVRDSIIAKGFVAFAIVFTFILIWKGSELYLQIYQWDKDWLDIIAITGEDTDFDKFAQRANFSLLMNQIFGLLSGISVGGTFVYLYRLMR